MSYGFGFFADNAVRISNVSCQRIFSAFDDKVELNFRIESILSVEFV